VAARLNSLWTAIVRDELSRAEPLFFPGSVYVRMKTGIITNPASDYASRLVAFFRLDLAAYHSFVGGAATRATLIGVRVAPGTAQWIAPGACENHFGYWHLPNVRLVFSSGGAVRSFAVASLISWRGEWYVVHLGPNPRPYNIGTVALPATGAGTPGPGGGC